MEIDQRSVLRLFRAAFRNSVMPVPINDVVRNFVMLLGSSEWFVRFLAVLGNYYGII